MLSALRYEVRRIISIRATWVLLIVSLLLSAMFSALQLSISAMQSGIDGRSPVDLVFDNAQNPISLVCLATIAAMSFGHEYRYGTMRLTLTAIPRRGRMFFAKTTIAAAFMLLGYLLNLAASFIVSLIAGPDRARFVSLFARQTTSTDRELGQWSSLVIEDIGRAALYVVIFGLFAFAITAVVRNLALGVVIPLILANIFEPLVLGFLETKWLFLNDVLPFNNGTLFLDWVPAGDSPGGGLFSDPSQIDYAITNIISPIQAGLVFAAWAVGLLALAYTLFERRDA